MHRSEARNWIIFALAVAAFAPGATAPAAAGEMHEPSTIRPINAPRVDQELDVDVVVDDPVMAFDQSWREMEVPPTLSGQVMTFSQRNPVVAAPLPPAVLSGGVLLAGHWIYSIFRKRRV